MRTLAIQVKLRRLIRAFSEARVLAPGKPGAAPGAGPGPLRQGVTALGRPGDRRAWPGGGRPGAAARRLRGGGAAARGVPARPGRRAGPAALRLAMTEIKDTDWAYAAGFVDGEGCIAIARSFKPRRGRFYYSVHIVVSNRDRGVLDWMQINWGGWIVSASSPLRGLKARQAWNWRTQTGQSARPFLTGIRPYLRLKIPQCDNALAMIELSRRSRRTLGRQTLPKAWLDEQEALYWKQRELNHRGSDDFVRKAMHSSRKIHRLRLSGA